MSAAGSLTGWTYAEYARLPDDGNRYEVLDGQVLMTPAPGTPHQRIAARLYVELNAHVTEHRLGEVMWDIDLLFMPGQFLRPDMLVVPASARDSLTDRGMEGCPSLVVEVVSPSSKKNDRVTKPARYAAFGVPEYWAVDLEGKSIWVWDFAAGATEPTVEGQVVVWQPDAGARDVPALEIAVPALFEVQ